MSTLWGRGGGHREAPLGDMSCAFPAAEPPVARLLHHGLPRAFSLPEDTRGPSDTEETAEETAVQLSELLPLPVLMKHSVTAPLAAQ